MDLRYNHRNPEFQHQRQSFNSLNLTKLMAKLNCGLAVWRGVTKRETLTNRYVGGTLNNICTVVLSLMRFKAYRLLSSVHQNTNGDCLKPKPGTCRLLNNFNLRHLV